MEIEISRRSYNRLLEARDEMGLQTIDETFDTILEFWFSWVDRAAVLELVDSQNPDG